MQRTTATPETPNYQSLYDAVDQVGPRTYRLITTNQTDKLNFAVIGCQGNGKESQKAVANLIDNASIKPDFILILGDNLYNDGAASPEDPLFYDYFYNIYEDHISRNQLNQTKFFLCLGNHDYNFHKATRIKSHIYMNKTQGKTVALNQVAHTYTTAWREMPLQEFPFLQNMEAEENNEDFDIHSEVIDTSQKIEIFSKSTLALEDLDKWNMPYYYYSLIIDDIQIFMLDSNTYASDFVEWINNPSKYESEENCKKNQAAWLSYEFKLATDSGKKIMLAQHHPLYTSGKRAERSHFDTNDYLKPQELTQLQSILQNPSESYNALLRLIFDYQKMNFDLVFAAHDHCLQYYNEKSHSRPDGLCQITSGGGGGDLQRRVHFQGHEHVGCYLKNNGYVSISCEKKNPQDILIDFYSTANHHLRFTNNNHHPICDPINNMELSRVRQIILSSVDQYFSLLRISSIIEKKRKQSQGNLTSMFNSISTTLMSITNYLGSYENTMQDDIDEIHDITAYLNQATLPGLEDALSKLYDLFSALPKKLLIDTTHAFNASLNLLAPLKQLQSQAERDIFIAKATETLENQLSEMRIMNADNVAQTIIDFTMTLTNNKHPFHVLIDSNLADSQNGLTLEDLYMRHITGLNDMHHMSFI